MSSSQFSFKSSGFKQTDRRFKKKTVAKQRPIGIKTPLELDDDIFKMHNNPIKQISDNFRNMILTNKGERLGRYDFGANLKSLVFEYSNNESFEEILASTVLEETKKYFPEILIQDVTPVALDVNEKNNFNNLGLTKVKISITYTIPKFKSPNLGIEVDVIVGG
jgi:phage baseplate assembly protein W